MSTVDLDRLRADWARLGVMYCVQPSAQTPDVERLLLDTARHGGADSRLFTMAAAWLSRYSRFVDAQRLARLIEIELPLDAHPAMGMLLEWSGASGAGDFEMALAGCRPPLQSRPMFDVYREKPLFMTVAESEATTLSRKWGRWLSESRLRTDALRPSEWVIAQNPKLAGRARVAPARQATSVNSN